NGMVLLLPGGRGRAGRMHSGDYTRPAASARGILLLRPLAGDSQARDDSRWVGGAVPDAAGLEPAKSARGTRAPEIIDHGTLDRPGRPPVRPPQPGWWGPGADRGRGPGCRGPGPAAAPQGGRRP